MICKMDVELSRGEDDIIYVRTRGLGSNERRRTTAEVISPEMFHVACASWKAERHG